jgi:hypothetical protein
LRRTYQLRAYLPSPWATRIRAIAEGPDGHVLTGENERLGNLLGHEPAWIIVSAQLLERNLQSTFGRANLTRIKLQKVATFDRPGSRTQLGIRLAAPGSATADPCGQPPPKPGRPAVDAQTSSPSTCN